MSVFINAVAMLSKMGTGRLSRGQQLMAPLPPSWTKLSQQLAAKRQLESHSGDVRSDGPARPVSADTNGRHQRAEDPTRPTNPAAKGRHDRPEPSARPSAAASKGRQQAVQGSSKPPQTGATKPDDQAHGLANGRMAEPKGMYEKAKGASNGQKRPAWGAAQPPSHAARVAEARTFKVCKRHQLWRFRYVTCHCQKPI